MNILRCANNVWVETWGQGAKSLDCSFVEPNRVNLGWFRASLLLRPRIITFCEIHTTEYYEREKEIIVMEICKIFWSCNMHQIAVWCVALRTWTVVNPSRLFVSSPFIKSSIGVKRSDLILSIVQDASMTPPDRSQPNRDSEKPLRLAAITLRKLILL